MTTKRQRAKLKEHVKSAYWERHAQVAKELRARLSVAIDPWTHGDVAKWAMHLAHVELQARGDDWRPLSASVQQLVTCRHACYVTWGGWKGHRVIMMRVIPNVHQSRLSFARFKTMFAEVMKEATNLRRLPMIQLTQTGPRKLKRSQRSEVLRKRRESLVGCQEAETCYGDSPDVVTCYVI